MRSASPSAPREPGLRDPILRRARPAADGWRDQPPGRCASRRSNDGRLSAPKGSGPNLRPCPSARLPGAARHDGAAASSARLPATIKPCRRAGITYFRASSLARFLAPFLTPNSCNGARAGGVEGAAQHTTASYGDIMKKIALAIALIALGSGSAMAFGPSPSDADPPGALFASKPGGVDHVPRAVREMQTAPVSLSHHWRARGAR